MKRERYGFGRWADEGRLVTLVSTRAKYRVPIYALRPYRGGALDDRPTYPRVPGAVRPWCELPSNLKRSDHSRHARIIRG
jgi:hypothetical protein